MDSLLVTHENHVFSPVTSNERQETHDKLHRKQTEQNAKHMHV